MSGIRYPAKGKWGRDLTNTVRCAPFPSWFNEGRSGIRYEKYPCLNPKNEEMWSEKKREKTFEDGFWPYHIRASPLHLAKAGLYFVGRGDRVKCWYCGCGLGKWEIDDVPWEEHAKYSPGCEFLLRNMGETFVEKFVQRGQDVCGPNWEDVCEREIGEISDEEMDDFQHPSVSAISEAVAHVRRLRL